MSETGVVFGIVGVEPISVVELNELESTRIGAIIEIWYELQRKRSTDIICYCR
jgi:hypothetical protein